jgi:putative phosphoribosyl transferase
MMRGNHAFQDRAEAGKLLAEKLLKYRDQADLLVLALPRGGVPVAMEVAHALHAPLDVFLVRKLGVPGQEELALGAVATGGVRVLNQDVMQSLHISQEELDTVTTAEQQELERRQRAYRDARPAPEIRDHTIILIDDGLATGASMRAAVLAVRQQHPKRIVVAVPAAAPETCDEFRGEVDEIICAITPFPFYGVGLWYEDFSQVTDEEVRSSLASAQSPQRVENAEIPD